MYSVSSVSPLQRETDPSNFHQSDVNCNSGGSRVTVAFATDYRNIHELQVMSILPVSRQQLTGHTTEWRFSSFFTPVSLCWLYFLNTPTKFAPTLQSKLTGKPYGMINIKPLWGKPCAMNVAQLGFKIVLSTAQMNAIEYDWVHVYFIISFDVAVMAY